ncbi:MAG: amidase [Bacteroidetes bacterium GWF2_33_16]|nr:MAG: amidase [Bacteroidetes bacterium GWE2_32_14]OFY07641.1 MAG: amidase [Bacteroidetes bacterium GWF2_33_16]
MKRIEHRFLQLAIVLLILLLAFSCSKSDSQKITADDLVSYEKITGLEFTVSERDSLLSDLEYAKGEYKNIRKTKIENSVSPRLNFDPRPRDFKINNEQKTICWNLPATVELPKNKAELAFMPVYKLASLIKERKITSVELTQIYIERLKKYGDTLECVITLTEDLAMAQAKRADEEMAMGKYRGYLHGIPYGLKDLFSVPGYKTTWGSVPYKDQILNDYATVYQKLEQAGAVLVAKLTMGALAMGDVWYNGETKNPWDLSQGSSGSSAGSASATAAGLVAFAIGTETWGSIVSPATRCGVTGLRPTFGRVSRNGAMALSWTMDKVGPICRSAYDCALVFDVIRGKDSLDNTTVDYPFNYSEKTDIVKLRVGYLKDLFEGEDYPGKSTDLQTIEVLKMLGVDFKALNLPENLPVNSCAIILEAEAGAAFDELTRSNADDKMIQQHKNAWPNIFRKSRFIPAVEYIQASRIRDLLIEELNALMKNYDVIVCPSFGGDQLLMTNLTGHPCVVVPNGFDNDNHPTSISFIGNLYDEATLLAFAKAYQNATEFDNQVPPMFK